ncbi:MAG: hypothetical protein IKJ63_02840 [Clostridia bacterium]|nr:hypothetical protein [Clostridia bacterium]
MNELNNGVTYIFGENAAIDGELNGEWLLDFAYYKNTPIWNDFFAKLRNIFWEILRPLIEMLNT